MARELARQSPKTADRQLVALIRPLFLECSREKTIEPWYSPPEKKY